MKSADVLPSRTAGFASMAKTGGTGGARNEQIPVWNPMTSFRPPRTLLLWAKTGFLFRMSVSAGGRRTVPRPRKDPKTEDDVERNSTGSDCDSIMGGRSTPRMTSRAGNFLRVYCNGSNLVRSAETCKRALPCGSPIKYSTWLGGPDTEQSQSRASSAFRHMQIERARATTPASASARRVAGTRYSVSFDFIYTASFSPARFFAHVHVSFHTRATHALRLFKELQRRAARLGCRC